MAIKSSKRHIKTRLLKPYITAIAANTVGRFFDVFAASATWKLDSGTWAGQGFMSPERINSKLMEMLWSQCKIFKLEALRLKFDCNFELIKAELTQRCLMTNLGMESFFTCAVMM